MGTFFAFTMQVLIAGILRGELVEQRSNKRFPINNRLRVPTERRSMRSRGPNNSAGVTPARRSTRFLVLQQSPILQRSVFGGIQKATRSSSGSRNIRRPHSFVRQ